MISISSPLFRRGRWIGLVVLMSVSARTALAEPSLADKTAAESLFAEGKKQLNQKRYAEACKSFSDSQRLDPGLGTLLNLAVCYEKLGKLASAWTIYHEAAAVARDAKQPAREQIARKGADALENGLESVSFATATFGNESLLRWTSGPTTTKLKKVSVSAAVNPGLFQRLDADYQILCANMSAGFPSSGCIAFAGLGLKSHGRSTMALATSSANAMPLAALRTSSGRTPRFTSTR